MNENGYQSFDTGTVIKTNDTGYNQHYFEAFSAPMETRTKESLNMFVVAQGTHT